MNRDPRRTADVALTIAIGAALAAAGVTAALMPWQAAVLPLGLAAVGVGLAAALAVFLIRYPAPAGGSVLKAGDRAMLLWFLIAVAATTLLGFELGGFLFALGYFRFRARFGWGTALALAIPVPVLAYLAFDVLLGRRSFDGVILGGLF